MGTDRAAAEDPAEDPVLLERRQGVAIVTLNRPQQRNAINVAAAQRLGAIVTELEADPGIRAVILTGAGGRAFSAGADLRLVAAGGVGDLMLKEGGFAGFVQARRRTPWIAAVEGFALAGGCELALACDLIVAAEDAAFGLPEVARGLVAAAGGLFRLPRAIPLNIARELVLTTGRLPAPRAHALGLVNRLAEPGQALAGALSLAGEIAANAPLAIAESLALLREAATTPDDVLWRQSSEALERLKQTEDLTEGATAFVEKRPPVWRGR